MDYLMTVKYELVVMSVIYEILIANIVIIMMTMLFKETINTKINISPTIILVISIIVLLIIVIAKIIGGFIYENDVDKRITILSNALQVNNLNKYYEINFDSSIDLEDIEEIIEKANRYMSSFNNMLNKGTLISSELMYKIRTNGLEGLVSSKSMSKKEALQTYKESAEYYIDDLNYHKEILTMQNVVNIIICSLYIICIVIVYVKVNNSYNEYEGF